MCELNYHVRRCFPRATVCRDCVESTEDLESWVTLNTIFGTDISLLSAVYLGQGNLLLLERGGGLLVLRCEGFAVTTPWCEDWDELVEIDSKDRT